MPRFAIKQARALHTIYRDADDVVDAINLARRALIDHAKHGELDVYRVPDNPDAYDQARDDQMHFRQGADRDSEEVEAVVTYIASRGSRVCRPVRFQGLD